MILNKSQQENTSELELKINIKNGIDKILLYEELCLEEQKRFLR